MAIEKHYLSLICMCGFLLVVLYSVKEKMTFAVQPLPKKDKGYPQKHTQRDGRPHIVMVVTDDQGFNDIGYHNPDIRSPTLDNLARKGVILENYYVQPVCTPTRSQLLSGRYQIHTGLQDGICEAESCKAIPVDMPLVSDRLKQAGYKTHAIGKWHVGFCKEAHLPTNRGFDSFFGFLTGHQDHYTREHCAKRCGRDLRDNLTPVRADNGTYSTILLAEKAVERIENHDTSQPMFLYLAFSALHGPKQVPERYRKLHINIPSEMRQTHAGMVTCVDEAVANVTRALKRHSMWKDTVFVYTTDNGGNTRKGGSNYPLKGWKGSYWEGGIRAVGFVHSPLLRRKVVGTVSRQLMHVSDWYPTFLSLAGVQTTASVRLDGFNQWGVINGVGQNHRTEFLINISASRRFGVANPEYSHIFNTNIRAGIRSGDWKLVTGTQDKPALKSPTNHKQTQNVFLFNITADKRERTDLSTRRPDIVRELLGKLRAYQRTAVPSQDGTYDKRANPDLHGGFWGPWL